METAQFDNIIFLHICRNPHLFKTVDDDFFKNPFVQKLYRMVQAYHAKFKALPFKPDQPAIDQIAEIATRNPAAVAVDSTLTPNENVQQFVTNANHVIQTDYTRYEPQWLSQQIKAWVEWENWQKGMRLALEYQKMQKITPENVADVVKKCRSIMTSRQVVALDDDLGADFYDPQSHKQLEAGEYVNSGYRNLNLWTSNLPGGGFERGTLSMFWAAPNVGKSIFLANIAYNMSLNGYNVLMISLEMAVYKIFRRIGSNAFQIPMGQYSNIAANPDHLGEYIKQMKAQAGTTLIPPGMLRGKKLNRATVADIQNYKRRVEQEFGIKIHAVVLDYATELANAYGVTSDSMYMYHKQNTDDMFIMAGEDDVAMISAHQLKVTEGIKDDIYLGSAAESSGITQRPDNIFGIIQTPDMKLSNVYDVKNLKSRDGEYKDYRIRYSIDYNHMRLIEHATMMAPGVFSPA